MIDYYFIHKPYVDIHYTDKSVFTVSFRFFLDNFDVIQKLSFLELKELYGVILL